MISGPRLRKNGKTINLTLGTYSREVLLITSVLGAHDQSLLKLTCAANIHILGNCNLALLPIPRSHAASQFYFYHLLQKQNKTKQNMLHRIPGIG